MIHQHSYWCLLLESVDRGSCNRTNFTIKKHANSNYVIDAVVGTTKSIDAVILVLDVVSPTTAAASTTSTTKTTTNTTSATVISITTITATTYTKNNTNSTGSNNYKSSEGANSKSVSSSGIERGGIS